MTVNLTPAPRVARKVPGCSLIYEPAGRAREYASLAANVYSGCDHRCVYCYAPLALRRSPVSFTQSAERPGFLAKLKKEAARYQAAGVAGRVLLCFTTDPYQRLDEKAGITRRAIETLHAHGLAVEVLTKGGTRALRDLDLFTPADAFATTLTLLDPERSARWEPGAAGPINRIAAIREFHRAGVPTWVSLEPVIDPDQALAIICETAPVVDVFKVGKLNYAGRLPTELRAEVENIDWPTFARDAIELLTKLGFAPNQDPDTLTAGQFYLKRDLACLL
jgi:DNA repair photolyase